MFWSSSALISIYTCDQLREKDVDSLFLVVCILKNCIYILKTFYCKVKWKYRKSHQNIKLVNCFKVKTIAITIWDKRKKTLNFSAILVPRYESDTTSLSLSLFTFMHWRKDMATHSSVLAWRIPGTGEPGGLPSMGSHRVRQDWRDLAAAAAVPRQSFPPFKSN